MASIKSPPIDPFEQARFLIARVRSGEDIPLSEVIAFLELSDKSLTREVKKFEEAPKDVDFF